MPIPLLLLEDGGRTYMGMAHGFEGKPYGL